MTNSTETPTWAPTDSTSEPSEQVTAFAYRGNGKIARLPKPTRDRINQWMLDGISYPEIIARLGDEGTDLKPDNFSQWKKRGHRDWLLEQAWLAQTRARQEPAASLSTDYDATLLNHAALQLGTLHMFEALRDLCPSPTPGSGLVATGADQDPPSMGSESNQNSKSKNQKARSLLDLKLGGDSAAFVRLIHALTRASRETMVVQKYRDACAQARAQLQPLRDPKRELTESERRAIVRKVDEILGLASPDEDASDCSSRREEAAVSPSSSDCRRRGDEAHNNEPSDCRRRGDEALTLKAPAANDSAVPAEPSGADRSGNVGAPKTPPYQNGTASEPKPTQNPKIDDPLGTDSMQSKLKTQNSKIPEFCPHCKAPVSPRQPNGIRPDTHCQHCLNPLPFLVVPGAQPHEFCPQCDVLLPSLLPDGQRPSPACRCGSLLPPPGMAAEQKTDHCTECGARLPAIGASGDRPSPNCPDCGTSLPPPLPATTWVSEYCRFCATHLPPSLRTRHRIRENCMICCGPLPPVGG